LQNVFHEIKAPCFQVKYDGFVKSRHSSLPVPGRQVKTGVQRIDNYLKRLDSGFRRNDGKQHLNTFYEIVKYDSILLKKKIRVKRAYLAHLHF